mmetsp:Transcript_25379/g.34958  ORF Transcript_25379/g.34958 Transcript_25379/m.34958 type:complete len:82 (+) Transcript_25379:1-246(+)
MEVVFRNSDKSLSTTVQELVQLAGLGHIEETRNILLNEADEEPNIRDIDRSVALISAAFNDQLEETAVSGLRVLCWMREHH